MGHVDRVSAKVGQGEVAQQTAAVGVRVGAHAAVGFGRQAAQLARKRTVLVEELLRSVTAHPGLELSEVFGVGAHLTQGHLVGAKRALDRQAVDDLGPRPALGRAQDDHRPGGPLGAAVLAGGPLDLLDLFHHLVENLGHAAVGRFGLVALDEVGVVAVALKELFELAIGHPSQHRGAGDLVAVQVQDRQHGAVACRVQELVRVPAGCQRSRLGLAIADDAGDQQIGVVEGGAVGVRQ